MSDHNDDIILVIPREKFDELGAFQGFSDDPKYWELLKHTQPMRRGDAENDPRFKQLVSYNVFITFQDTDVHSTLLVSTYTRGAGGSEARLVGKKSIGKGGHMEAKDGSYEAARDRELGEEFPPYKKYKPRIFDLGFVNDDSNEVGSVHLGVVHIAYLPPDAALHSEETGIIENLQWLSPEELRLCNLETWTSLILEEVALWSSNVIRYQIKTRQPISEVLDGLPQKPAPPEFRREIRGYYPELPFEPLRVETPADRIAQNYGRFYKQDAPDTQGKKTLKVTCNVTVGEVNTVGIKDAKVADDPEFIQFAKEKRPTYEGSATPIQIEPVPFPMKLEMENGSSIEVTPSAGEPVRGRTEFLQIIDDAMTADIQFPETPEPQEATKGPDGKWTFHGDWQALELLQKAGYTLKPNVAGDIVYPSKDHKETDDERQALDYLFEEWDYGTSRPE